MKYILKCKYGFKSNKSLYLLRPFAAEFPPKCSLLLNRKNIAVGGHSSKLVFFSCTQDLKSDYLPVDLCKPLVPVFTSHESLINNMYTPEPTSRHSLTPAPLPLTGQPAQPPTEATTDKQTHHNSFLRELSPVREGEVGGGGKSGETVGVGEVTSSGGATSSGNTSGYSTGSGDSDNQQHESGTFIHCLLRIYIELFHMWHWVIRPYYNCVYKHQQ